MHDFLSVALVVAFSIVCKNSFTGFYSPGDIMSSFGETSTIIWSRETIGVWEIQMQGAKRVLNKKLNNNWMNETKIEEILNQYQFKQISCTDRGCWALDLAQNLPSQIIPGQSLLYNHDHHHCHLQDHLDHHVMIAPWKPEVDFAACDSSTILMFYPLVPRTQDLWILSSFLPALIIPWSTIWPNHNDPRWSPQRATMWSYDLMIQDERWKSHLLRPVPPGHLRHRPSSTSLAPVLIVTIVLEIWGKQ